MRLSSALPWQLKCAVLFPLAQPPTPIGQVSPIFDWYGEPRRPGTVMDLRGITADMTSHEAAARTASQESQIAFLLRISSHNSLVTELTLQESFPSSCTGAKLALRSQIRWGFSQCSSATNSTLVDIKQRNRITAPAKMDDTPAHDKLTHSQFTYSPNKLTHPNLTYPDPIHLA